MPDIDRVCTEGVRLRKWYAVRVASNYEKSVAQALRGRGVEEFLPLYTPPGPALTRRPAERVLFPGYLFGRFDVCRRLDVLTIPGVVHIVSAGRTPAPVDDEELEAIRRLVRSSLPLEPWPFLRAGERVSIRCGPLRGLCGIVLEVNESCRVIVSLSLLQRSVAVEIARDSLAPEPAFAAALASGF